MDTSETHEKRPTVSSPRKNPHREKSPTPGKPGVIVANLGLGVVRFRSLAQKAASKGDAEKKAMEPKTEAQIAKLKLKKKKRARRKREARREFKKLQWALESLSLA